MSSFLWSRINDQDNEKIYIIILFDWQAIYYARLYSDKTTCLEASSVHKIICPHTFANCSNCLWPPRELVRQSERVAQCVTVYPASLCCHPCSTDDLMGVYHGQKCNASTIQGMEGDDILSLSFFSLVLRRLNTRGSYTYNIYLRFETSNFSLQILNWLLFIIILSTNVFLVISSIKLTTTYILIAVIAMLLYLSFIFCKLDSPRLSVCLPSSCTLFSAFFF